MVRSVSSRRNKENKDADGKVTDTHFTFEDGRIQTIHIYRNESATTRAGVYIPKEFSQLKITSKDTVTARNPKTGEVILIAHVKVGYGKKAETALRANLKNAVRENGTFYIGEIGGKGGKPSSDGRGRDAHLSFFPSEKDRLAATAFKEKTVDTIVT